MKILFLSMGNQYLEHSLYCKLVENLPSSCTSIYLRSDYEDSDSVLNLREKELVFSRVISHPCPVNKKSWKSISGLWDRIQFERSLVKWRKSFIKLLDDISPQKVIVLNPFLVNYLVLSLFRSDLEVFYLQSCNTKTKYSRLLSTKDKLKIFWYEKILRVPIKSKESNPLAAVGINKYLFWSQKWVPKEFGNTKKSELKFVGSMVNDSLLKSFKKIKLLHDRPKVLIVLNKEKSIGLEGWLIYKDFYRELIEAYPDFQFIIRPHPLGDFRLIEKYFSDCRISNTMNVDNVDLLINHWSSLTWEAIFLGVPTVLVNPKGFFDFGKRFLDEYPLIINEVCEIKEVFNGLTEYGDIDFNAIRINFLTKYFHQLDGKSGQRTIEELLY
jgi:hypothetical protein